MITDQEAEAAHHALIETDYEDARLAKELEHTILARKKSRAAVYDLGKGTQEARKAFSECHQTVQECDARYVSAYLAYKALENKRDSWKRTISMWQSFNKRLI